MLNVKVREAYEALGYDLTKYPAQLSSKPVQVFAVTGKAIRPHLCFQIRYYGGHCPIMVECAVTTLPGL